MRRSPELFVLVLAALLLVMAPAKASPDVFVDEDFATGSYSGDAIVIDDDVHLAMRQTWVQTLSTDFQRWRENENVASRKPGDVRLATAGDRWVEKRYAPQKGGHGEAIVGAGGYIYLAKQLTKAYPAYLHRYDPAGDNWTEDSLAVPPENFKSGTALAWDNGGYIYALLGGASTDIDSTGRHYFSRYSISGDSWAALAGTSGINPRGQGAGDAMVWVPDAALGVGDDNYIYAIVGSAKHKPAGLGRYSIKDNAWVSKKSPPAGVDDGCSLTWAGGKYLYALRGEYYETSPLYDFWRYDMENDTWADMARPYLWAPGGTGDGASLLWMGGSRADFICALSGASYDENCRRLFSCYSISANSWIRLANLPMGVGYYVGNRLGRAGDNLYCWRGTRDDTEGAGDRFWVYEFPEYPLSGMFTSMVFDAGTGVLVWENIWWSGATPTGTSLRVYVRTGDTPAPDASWSSWAEVVKGSRPTTRRTRYIQYKVGMSTSDNVKTPVLYEVRVTYVASLVACEWVQHEWGRSTTPSLQVGKWDSTYDNFYRAENLDVSEVEEVRLSSATDVVYGSAFAVRSDSTATTNLKASNRKVSLRFVAQKTGELDNIRVRLIKGGPENLDWTFRLENDDGTDDHLPSGTLAWGGAQATVKVTASGMWIANITNGTLENGRIYHVVIVPENTPSSENYVNPNTTLPFNDTWIGGVTTNENRNVCFYDGSGWINKDREPVYVLDYADGTYEGNPYYTYYTTYYEVNADNYLGENITVTGGDKNFQRVAVYLRKVGAPPDLRFRIIDGAGTTVAEDNFPAASTPTSWGWVERDLGDLITLRDNSKYRFHLWTGGDASNKYQVSIPDTYVGVPYPGLTYDGENSVFCYSTDAGASWSTAGDRDLAFKFLPPRRYKLSAELHSSIYDAGQVVSWRTINWEASAPSGKASKARRVSAEPVRLVDGSERVGSTASSYFDARRKDNVYENISETALYGENAYSESEGPSSTTSLTFVDKTTLTFTPPKGDKYMIAASALVTATYVSATDRGRVDVQLVGDGVVYAVENFTPKDKTDNYAFAAHKVVYLDNTTHVFKIQYRSAVADNEAKIKQARIWAKRIAVENVENEPPDSTTSTTYESRVTLSFTPPSAGDYLLLATADFAGSSTSYSTFVRLFDADVIENENIAESQREPTVVTDNYSFATMKKLGLPASTRTFKLQYRTSGATAWIRNARLTAIRADDLGAIRYEENDAVVSDNSGSWITRVTLSFTPASTQDYLVITSAMVRRNAAGARVEARLLHGSTDLATKLYTAQDATDYASFFACKKVELAAGTTENFFIQWRTPAAAATHAFIKQARIVAIPAPRTMNWEHRITGVENTLENCKVRIYGYSGGDENVGIYIWRQSALSWEFVDNLPTSENWREGSLDNVNNYLVGNENVCIKYGDWVDNDNVMATIRIDYCALEGLKPYSTAVRVWTRSGTDGNPYDEPSPPDNWSGWVESASGDNLPWENRYLQHRFTLSTDDPDFSPVMRGVSMVNFDAFAERSGTFTSQVLDLGYVDDWGNLTPRVTAPSGTSVSLATRSSEDGRGWSDWKELGARAIRSPIYGRCCLQVRATLRGRGSTTPTLHSYTINYTPDRTPPAISPTSPEQDFTASEDRVWVGGRLSDSNPVVELRVNGRPITPTVKMLGDSPSSVEFGTWVRLSGGQNTIRITARDIAGNEGRRELQGTYTPPEIPGVVKPGVTEYPLEGVVLVAAVGAMIVVVLVLLKRFLPAKLSELTRIVPRHRKMQRARVDRNSRVPVA